MLKSLFLFLIVAILSTQNIFASTRGDVKILEASENIQYLSQKIATDYFFFYKNPKDSLLKKQLYKSIDNLSSSIKEINDIADIKKEAYVKKVLEYFKYLIEKIKEVPNKKINLKNMESILTLSELLLEGAKSIAKEHRYKFSKEEKMLMLNKEILYLLKRINKYYLALSIGLNSNTNYEKMVKAIENMDKKLKIINRYLYPKDLEEKLSKINEIWSINREFFYQVKRISIPYILSTSTQYMEDLVIQLEQHHKRNL